MTLGMVMTFQMPPPKAQSMKEVTDKLDFIKIKNFCSTKNYANDGEDKSQIGRKHICKIPT